jgi:glycosyltransferase involved in cell wall biosynthesis
LENALRGFIGQVTTFPFEIIVRDDASSDGTSDIVREYAARYPNIIRSVLEKENQYSKGVRATPVLVNLARGQYVALCEGDDYWITSDKLEKQVQLLRDHPQASMSVARTVVCKYSEGQGWICPSMYSDNDKDLQEFEDIKTGYFHTSTYVIRTALYRDVLNKYSSKIQIGPFVLLKEIVSVYRYTGQGMWSSMNENQQKARLIKALEEYYQHFDRADYKKHFGEMLYVNYRWMLRNGNWAINKKSPFENFGRFVFFTLKYRIRRDVFSRLMRRVLAKVFNDV